MPRQRRKPSKSRIYHVMVRGNERKNLFLDDEDREKFLYILHEKGMDRNYSIYSYCLMDNHVHLLISEGQDEIQRIMKRIEVSYAYYFNKKYRRVGHLFQDRYKSEAIEDDGYLLAALRYIHHNPVKAGIVKKPFRYKWSSYLLYTGDNEYPDSMVDKSFILEIFSSNREKAVRMFKDYSNRESDNSFIDYHEEVHREISISTEKAAAEYIIKFLKHRDMKLEELKEKNHKDEKVKIINDLKTISNLSTRQIACLLGVNRNMVQRTD